MDDTANHPAVVDTRLATRVRRQMRLDPRKLRVREPETIPIHPRSLPEAVNHTEPAKPTTLWVRTLVIRYPGLGWLSFPLPNDSAKTLVEAIDNNMRNC